MTCVPPLRYVRVLGNVVHAIQIKTKLCQLVEVMMERRDDLSFCQEMKFRFVTVTHTSVVFLYFRSGDIFFFLSVWSFHSYSVVYRNKMVEYLTDWVMGTSNQAADDDIKCLTRYSSVTHLLTIQQLRRG